MNPNPITYSFENCLLKSKANRCPLVAATIRSLIPDCVKVEETTIEIDKTGVDYFAYLKNGRRLNIDEKKREKGASCYWENKSDPDVALERWSVCPSEEAGNGKIGWTLSLSSQTDLVLFSYDESDCAEVFLLPFPQLRIAFSRNIENWASRFKQARQRTTTNFSSSYYSECVFVPISAVWAAIIKCSQGKLGGGDLPDDSKIHAFENVVAESLTEHRQLDLFVDNPECY